MKEKPKIMIDMDDVICSGGFLYLINEFLGTNYEEKDVKDFYMQNLVSDKEAFFKYFFTKNMYDYCDLKPFVKEVIEELNECFDIYIGTAYVIPEMVKESGIMMLHKYNYLQQELPFLNPYNYVFLNDKSVLNCDIKIDDRFTNLKNARTKLLFTAYHNQDLKEEYLQEHNVSRVDNWLEVKQKLLKYNSNVIKL